jgi:hypothetical protein
MALVFLSFNASAGAPGESREAEPTKTDVTRIYLVKNANANLVALKDADLDEIPPLRRVGSAKSVQFKGVVRDVEYTIIVRGTTTTVLSRHLPVDDDEE